jgi:hypothetical protein
MFFSPRYLSTKRDVEDYLKIHEKDLHSAVLRCGFMPSKTEAWRRLVANILDTVNLTDALWDRLGLQGFKETMIPSRCISVEAVGKVAILAATQDQFRGRTFSIDEMEEIAINY